MNILDFVSKVKNKELDVVEHINLVLNKIEKINNEYNYFSKISKDLALKQAEKISEDPSGKLAGLPVSIKDCICVKGVESTASSKILKGFVPPYNATVVQKLIDEGAIIIGKTVQDEFGFGGFCTNVGEGYKIPFNPLDKERSCGGSSGGSAGITRKLDVPHVSIAESTGGSIACPASFCGVYGFTPTFGRVSRSGLMDYGSSLDKVGPMSRDWKDCKIFFDIMKGIDEKDSTTVDKDDNFRNNKFAIIKEAFDVEDEIKEVVMKKINKMGFEVEEVSLPIVKKYSIPSYYTIAMAEASTNLAKFCGLRYGFQPKVSGLYNDFFSNVRTEGFGEEAKRRIFIGTFARMAGYRDAYYIKALQVRRKIINEYKVALKKYDILFSPSMPIISPKIDEIKKLSPLEIYKMDDLTVGPNLAGLPHMSLNAGAVEDMPVGLMMISDHFKDNVIFSELEEKDGC